MAKSRLGDDDLKVKVRQSSRNGLPMAFVSYGNMSIPAFFDNYIPEENELEVAISALKPFRCTKGKPDYSKPPRAVFVKPVDNANLMALTPFQRSSNVRKGVMYTEQGERVDIGLVGKFLKQHHHTSNPLYWVKGGSLLGVDSLDLLRSF